MAPRTPLDRIDAAFFPDVYRSLGIDLGRLGCIMLGTDPVVVSDLVDGADLHEFDPVRRPYGRALASEPAAHVSLHYGLLRPGPQMREHVDAVLAGWRPEDVHIERVDVWPPDGTGRDHISVLGRLVVTDNLREAHARLSLLPHVDVHGPFRPHITLVHVRPGTDWRALVARLGPRVAGRTVAAREIGYGD